MKIYNAVVWQRYKMIKRTLYWKAGTWNLENMCLWLSQNSNFFLYLIKFFSSTITSKFFSQSVLKNKKEKLYLCDVLDNIIKHVNQEKSSQNRSLNVFCYTIIFQIVFEEQYLILGATYFQKLVAM